MNNDKKKVSCILACEFCCCSQKKKVHSGFCHVNLSVDKKKCPSEYIVFFSWMKASDEKKKTGKGSDNM